VSDVTPILRLEKLSRVYQVGSEKVHALDGISMDVYSGEYLAIMGPSGSGKSTLMHLFGLIDQPTSGRLLLDGKDLSTLESEEERSRLRGRSVGFIFQTFNLLPRLTALENVELPLIYQGIPAAERRERAMQAISRVQLEDRRKHKPNEMSGGQRQRVAIARALVGHPRLLLADEPTGNLDSKTGAAILELFDALHAEGHTLVVVTHEDDVAARAAREIHLLDGKIEKEIRR
jgi:putative ABC transport system ATP-binding protein